MRVLEKQKFKNCRLEIVPHVFRRAIERNFPLHKIKDLIFKAKWMPHLEDSRRTCVCWDNDERKYWTIIIAPYSSAIFIITLYQSRLDEIKEFKSFKEHTIDAGNDG